ncbi:MAG: nucleotidyltransferase family protein [Christensenellales bacterium]
MKRTGIICEYNPFTNGHSLHLNRAKELYGDEVVCIMSGEFTQRGEVAIASAPTRASWAIKGGAAAVVSMPAFSSMANAEIFALNGVRTAVRAGCEVLFFGSEEEDLSRLFAAADALSDDKTAESFRSLIKSGISYPSALSRAVGTVSADAAEILRHPNNILAVNYIAAIRRTGAPLTPVNMKRTDNGYGSTIPSCGFLSAGGIREKIKCGESPDAFVPPFVTETLKTLDPVKADEKFNDLLTYKLQCADKSFLSAICDMSEGLENRIKKAAESARDAEEFFAAVKSKRYTMSRIKRIAAYILLDVTRELADRLNSSSYGRIIAMRKDKKHLLSSMKRAGLATCFSDVKQEDIPFFEWDKKAASVAALIRGETPSGLNTVWL